MSLSCFKNCRVGDVMFLKRNPQEYLALSDYSDDELPNEPIYGRGHILVKNMYTREHTAMVTEDVKRLSKIIKAK